MKTILYIHGKGGSAAESEHFLPLFPDCRVVGLDYRSFTPWEAGTEIRSAAKNLRQQGEALILIANSIGALFCLHAGLQDLVDLAYFISPVVDMERMILDLMGWAGVTEPELRARGRISTSFGEDLSWDYLCYVRSHPIFWNVPTHILCGSGDTLIPRETLERFAEKHRASLTVMEGGEHWFHSADQLRFLDDWIRNLERTE